MPLNRKQFFRMYSFLLLGILAVASGYAGVSRTLQEQYKQNYENKAMFLKIPLYSERQILNISGQNIRIQKGVGTPRFRVGDQLRILEIDFGGDTIRFRMGAIATTDSVDIEFRFDENLQEDFPNKDVFDRALQSTLTEGLKYTEIENAKKLFIEKQFERTIQEIADSSASSRDTVLHNIAPRIPAYQDARNEIETLKNKVQDITERLSQSQSGNRRLQSESETLQAELNNQKNINEQLRKKIDATSSQVAKMGEDLRKAFGSTQGYQKELADIQRSLNLKVDPTRDLSLQIADFGQAMRKLKQENEAQKELLRSLQADLESQTAANARLAGDNEDLRADKKKLQSTIRTLTSKEDSIERQYMNLKNEKEKLDNFSRAVEFLRTRIEEEKTDDGIYSGKANVYLQNVLLGSLDWRIPVYLNHGQEKTVEARFAAESIDTVRMDAEERQILRSLGERLKMQVDLATSSDAMEVLPAESEPIQEIGERDRSSWQWHIRNRGAQDARILLSARLINKDSSEIPLFQEERSVIASNPVRRVRSYLQPIPLAAGAVLGFLLFGIVGIFRRPKIRKVSAGAPSGSSEPPPAARKQL
jgi:hypothetical protein